MFVWASEYPLFLPRLCCMLTIIVRGAHHVQNTRRIYTIVRPENSDVYGFSGDTWILHGSKPSVSHAPSAPSRPATKKGSPSPCPAYCGSFASSTLFVMCFMSSNVGRKYPGSLSRTCLYRSFVKRTLADQHDFLGL